ncbi:MAG TPA: hypothetical protein VJ866_19305 [Pyrinomonadaceae bacterium]|nr:hypothetical protein [Pyrinomonadaceae bacterium]
MQDEDADTIKANEKLGLDVDLRRYEQYTEVLLDIGLRRVRELNQNVTGTNL